MFEYFSDEQQRPDWVSESNSSLTVYEVLLKLIEEKTEYINHHRYETHFKTKKTYQISGREVASRAGLSSSTVIRTSSYSKNFMKYLKDVVNPELLKLKNERVKKFSKSKKPRGNHESTKSDLVSSTISLQKRLRQLEQKNIEKEVNAVIKQLKPEIRKLLFIG